MGYRLGIDLGTAFAAAAVGRDGRVEVIELGSASAAMASVVHLDADGTFLVGDEAARRQLAEPERTAREFKRRFGDPTAIILGGTPVSAEVLQGELLRHIVAVVTERMGEAPSEVAVTFPANWGPFKRELMAQMTSAGGVPDAVLLTEPEAAAAHYGSLERVEPGELVAVYDLGAGTFDAVVLRRTPTGYEIVGAPGGLEHLGGADFDQAVLEHAVRALGDDLPGPDSPDRDRVGALLRRECIAAKEALSSATSTTIALPLAAGVREVRLTRDEFEAMIRPALERTVVELRRVLDAAGVEPSQLKKVLLVGGSSRIPLVAQLVSEALTVPVGVDVDPKHAVARGAALPGAEAAATVAAAPPPTEDAVGSPLALAAAASAAADARATRQRKTVAAAVVAAAVVLGLAAWALGGSGEGDDVASGTTTSVPGTTTAPSTLETIASTAPPVSEVEPLPTTPPTRGPAATTTTTTPPPPPSLVGTDPCTLMTTADVQEQIGPAGAAEAGETENFRTCTFPLLATLPEDGSQLLVAFTSDRAAVDELATELDDPSNEVRDVGGFPAVVTAVDVGVLVEGQHVLYVGVPVDDGSTADYEAAVIALAETALDRLPGR